MAGFNADGTFNFDNNNGSLAGFGYQDPLYDPYDGMSKPGTYKNYGSSVGNVFAENPLDAIMSAADKNNAWSAAQAEKQNQFQIEQNEKAMQFNSAEAAKNRAWQEEMSNTAHQREVVDLQKAGLNPVLSATGGNGASVGSGATASGVTSAGAKGDTDESTTMAFVSYMAQLLQAQTSILNTQTSANATLANSQLMSEANKYASELGYLGVQYSSNKSYEASLNNPYNLAGNIARNGLDAFSEANTGVDFGTWSQNVAKEASAEVKDQVKKLWNKLSENAEKIVGSHKSGKF